MLWKVGIEQILTKKFAYPVTIYEVCSVSGGDINEAFKISTNTGIFFIKKNSATLYSSMFEKEAKGLQLLAGKSALKAPNAVASVKYGDEVFLMLDFIESGKKSIDFWDQFAKGLSQLHRNSVAYFGLDHDNYIGSLHQSNKKHDNWIDFFRAERLEKQVKLARDNGKLGKTIVDLFENFYKKLAEIFPIEPSALVHGDLWGGNYMTDEKGSPVIIDPAVYYGNREMDLGMSKLFGGFDSQFYNAYQNYFPMEKGWQTRLDYCNLYPLMVHVNLFGGGYLSSVQSILRKF